MKVNPYKYLNELIEIENKLTNSKSGFICCLSTSNDKGIPTGRMITIKSIWQDQIVFTTNLKSKKWEDITFNNQVALTFWLGNSQKQIRVNGKADKLDDETSNVFFEERNNESKIIAGIFDQRKKVEEFSIIKNKFDENIRDLEVRKLDVSKPLNWSAISVDCLSFEFFTFYQNRLHKRCVYQKEKELWNSYFLEP